MPLRSTFEIGTQIISLKIDGFLKGWILNITPLKGQTFTTVLTDLLSAFQMNQAFDLYLNKNEQEQEFFSQPSKNFSWKK